MMKSALAITQLPHDLTDRTDGIFSVAGLVDVEHKHDTVLFGASNPDLEIGLQSVKCMMMTVQGLKEAPAGSVTPRKTTRT